MVSTLVMFRVAAVVVKGSVVAGSAPVVATSRIATSTEGTSNVIFS
jgi:hypothetical protein